MSFLDTLQLALANIWAHKLRSSLTLLGMVVGVTAVVVVVSLIQGFNAYVDEKVAGIGAKVYKVYRFSTDDWKDQDSLLAAQRRNKPLSIEDFEYLRARATLTAQLGMEAFGTLKQIRRGADSFDEVEVNGATANAEQIRSIEVAEGRFFNEAENNAARRVAFVGAEVENKLFPDGAVGGELYIDGTAYRVVGVAAAKGTVFGQPQDSFVTVPLKTYAANFGNFNYSRSLFFIGTARSDEHFEDAVEEVRYLLRARRLLRPEEKDSFGIVTPDLIVGVRQRIFGPVFIVAVAVPGIALLVGSIVIMNIMLVTVTERTKEIGLRMAVGARRRDILRQFLVEAVALSACGGAVGILLAGGIGRVLTAYVFQAYLSLPAVAVAVATSFGVGVLSGLFPAWRAARLDPVEALRME